MAKTTTYPQQHGQCFGFGRFGIIGYLSPCGATTLARLSLQDALKSGAAYPVDGNTWAVLVRCDMPKMLYDKNAPTV